MFRKYLEKLPYFESGFRIPQGTQSIKLFHHVDLDGVFSAILAYNQLKRQGIDGERIQLYPVQYNQQKPSFFNVKPHQAAVVVDFGRFPQSQDGGYRPTQSFSPYFQKPGKRITDPKEAETFRKPDVVSDHHETPITTDANGRPSNSANGARAGASRDPKRLGDVEGMHRSDSERILTLHAQNLATSETINLVSKIDSAQYENLEDCVNLPLTSKTLAIVVNAMLTSVASEDLPVGSPNSRTKGTIEYLIRNAAPSLWSIYNILRQKASQICSDEIELVKELQKPQEERDDKKILEITSRLSKATVRSVRDGLGRKKENISLEGMRGKGDTDIKRSTDPEKTPFKAYGNVLVSKLAGANQPGRFTGSLLTKQDGTRYPALIRRWPTMMQVTFNPDLEKEHKKINLVDLVHEAIRSARIHFLGKDYIPDDQLEEMDKADKERQSKIDALPEVQDFVSKYPWKKVPNDLLPKNLRYGDGYKVWLNQQWKNVEEKAGGHASIANISDLGVLTLAPKETRDGIKKINAMLDRLKGAQSEKALAKIEELTAEKKELEGNKKESSEKREAILDYLQNYIVDTLNKELDGIAVTKPLNDPDRFKTQKPAPEEPEEEEAGEEPEEKPARKRVKMAVPLKGKKVKVTV